MNIKKHLIIANFLQMLYVIVNLLGVILGFFDGEKIIFLSMFWYIFIVPIHTINFVFYRKAIHYYEGMDKKIFANFDKQWVIRFMLMVAEMFIVPAIVIINIYTYILLISICIVELYLLLKSLTMKYKITKEFIKLNELDNQKSKLIVKNLKLTSLINKYKKDKNKIELLKKLDLILEETYIIKVFDKIEDDLYEYNYKDKKCFTSFEVAEFYFRNTEVNQAAKLCKLTKIIDECIIEDKNLKIYYLKNKFLKLTKDELIRLINKQIN